MAIRQRTKWLDSDPEFEAHKARRANIGHARAVRDSEDLRRSFLKMWKPRARPMVELKAILRTLQAKKIPFVLVGAHAIGSYTGRPRATKDVDILVRAGRNHARVVKAIRELYPELEVRKFQSLTAFFRPGERESVVDVAFPKRADNTAALETAVWVEDEGIKYRVPTLECALANKYGAMVSVTRDIGKRAQDAVDFSFMVRHSTDEGQTPIDMDRLAELGEMVWPGGGGKEIVRLIEDINAGIMPNVNVLAKG